MLVLADGMRVPIQTETILRDGELPSDRAGAKVGGGAAMGAILGAIIGGKKGAILGSTAGAAGGAVAAAAGDASEALIPVGANMTVRLSAAAIVTVERTPQLLQ